MYIYVLYMYKNIYNMYIYIKNIFIIVPLNGGSFNVPRNSSWNMCLKCSSHLQLVPRLFA